MLTLQMLEPYPLALLSATAHENDGPTAIVPFDLSTHFGTPSSLFQMLAAICTDASHCACGLSCCCCGKDERTSTIGGLM